MVRLKHQADGLADALRGQSHVRGRWGEVALERILEAAGLSEGRDYIVQARGMVDAAEYFKTHEPERLERLWQRMQGYRAMLAELRLRDEAVRSYLARRPISRRALGSWRRPTRSAGGWCAICTTAPSSAWSTR